MGHHATPRERIENARKRLRETLDSYMEHDASHGRHANSMADMFHHLADFVDRLITRRRH